MTRVRLRLLLLVACTATFAAGCNDDGRELRAPPPGATAPPVDTSTTAAPGGIVPSSLALTSSAFAEGAAIPVRYTCEGDRLSPPLSWTSVPADTAELVLTLVDPDASGFVHWIVSGIDPAVVGLGEGGVPEGAVEGRNDSSEFGWFPPCPPLDDGPHRYVFTLYALTAPSELVADTPPREAVATVATIPGAAATLSGVYER